MKFALVDNVKVEATKGAKGICPVCNKELIAKCGEVKINHWAHKKISDCVTNGGKTKRNGNAHGKIIFLQSGKKSFYQMNKQARNTLRIFGQFMVL